MWLSNAVLPLTADRKVKSADCDEKDYQSCCLRSGVPKHVVPDASAEKQRCCSRLCNVETMRKY